MTIDRTTLISGLRESGAAALAAMLAVPQDALSRGVYENGWNAHQLLAHIASMEFSYRRLAESVVAAGATPAEPGTVRPAFDMNAYNARQVERRRNTSATALIDEFIAGRAALVVDARGYPETLLEAPTSSAGGTRGVFADVLLAVAGQHVRSHAADLAAADRLPNESHQAIAALRLAAEEAALLCEAAPEEAWLRRPGAADWSAANVAGHLAEIMPYWAARGAGAAASQTGRLGRNLDAPERLGAVVDAERLSRAKAAARIRSAAAEACLTLGRVPAADWEREVDTARYGRITLRLCLQRLVIEHAYEHAEQIAAAASS